MKNNYVEDLVELDDQSRMVTIDKLKMKKSIVEKYKIKMKKSINKLIEDISEFPFQLLLQGAIPAVLYVLGYYIATLLPIIIVKILIFAIPIAFIIYVKKYE